MRLRHIFAAALVFAVPSARAEEPWRAYERHEAIEIPFANGPIAMEHVPQVWIGLRGARPR